MEAKGEKVVVVANIVDEAPSKLAVAGSPELAALNNGLTNEANALKGAATLLFCLSLFQVFTLHGFLGLVASALVLLYSERSPLGTAHAARFTHSLSVATAIFSAGALAAAMIVSVAVVPDALPEMVAACEEAQAEKAAWAAAQEAEPDARFHAIYVMPAARRLHQVAVENCDAVLEYASSALPLVLFFNILMQGSLMLAATSCAKHAALLMMKAQSLGAPAI
ncbi:hypothetical protein EMIHUDRAFT_431998 [Emiliania huxleyi CCMP1516]|uniref:Uncharacterized protein n=3 Tax=Emiliania huxleyi TaxID=2903 RepID=A0A0D3JGS8_EMIH1|nr:hypothetical protein EMIHUDRAFT_431998 [Emiliania huxleyi CCMP1516]EOD22713.1 hypothetical protein EMIHUDRAFT_431998 [Emiliania huxleyi CCMP1516]|mmetsp:Transcript_1859/g.6111  ORF Transcript_1859/g.6111 Transcript_1859/m.6111 type:complete len:223 (-) Transcript_1859:167-835(-)|eukprot:CAMPEP_0196715396 /NCGR_PEP_ID=MMETSP1090-20130531/76190_1 /TAXON_ID=37098 /ORGANISM="Isochrysis sp, Strain CCMP1244" /LENGTH=222 /DNA_ID=CAMNT_0042055501 /DNA_START=39 /DNA_END=707 /DNA_ORIENTATION=+